MVTLALDIETYSATSLPDAGVYAYAEDPDFRVLLIGFALDSGPVRVFDCTEPEDPAHRAQLELLREMITDPTIIKTAFNAQFERTCLARYFNTPMPEEQWQCTQVLAASLGLPLHLAGVCDALRLSEDVSKQTSAGKQLIKLFCIPQPDTGQTSFLPAKDPYKWKKFMEYNARDVEAERAVRNMLQANTLHPDEQRAWELDQRINAHGVRVDRDLVDSAAAMAADYKERLMQDAIQLTGLENPNSTAQLKKWLNTSLTSPVESLRKETLPALLDGLKEDDTITRRVLEIRQELGKTSLSKYTAIARSVNADDRVRGLFQFYGSNRTGRWAGRLVQVQNLPQNHLVDLGLARKLVLEGRQDEIEMFYGNLPDTLSQLIRTTFIPAPGHRFIVADFSAIEARIIAWLAEEKSVLDEFKGAGKIYEATAARMFGIPIERIARGYPEYIYRARGKVATLACGYQGAVNALINMGALRMGIQESELPALVEKWREANPHIVNLWEQANTAAVHTVGTGQDSQLTPYGITMALDNGSLYIQLPSGRRLAYLRPRIEPNRWGKPGITYAGTVQGSNAWGRIQTYGGKLVENIVQAIARDCLRDAMLALDATGYPIVMHVHDEVIIEHLEHVGSLQEVCTIMGRPLSWAPGLPLKAAGFETADYYMKD